MVLQKIYVQYEYHYSGYFLPNACIGVDGASGFEDCYSAFDGVSTGCGFNLVEGSVYDAAVTKDGYYLTGESILLDFTAPVNPFILLWLYPCEPTVVTHDATEITTTEAKLNGEVTDMDGLSRVFAGFQYGEVGESYTQGDEWASDYPEAIWDYLCDLTPGTTYNFRTRVSNITDEDTFYVFGETKQFTTLEAAVYTMHIVLPNANGKLFLSNTIIACDDPAKACTEFRFQIRNDGNVAKSAWYKVSVVGGGTLYDSSIASLSPGTTSVVIDDLVCALSGGLPVGTHTIKIETGPEGQAATDSITDYIYVIEEGPEPPTVVTVGANQINDTTVELQGELTSMGGASICDIYFRYGYDASCIWSSKESGVYDTVTNLCSFQLDIGWLISGGTIYYRAATACDGGSEVVGELKQITLSETVHNMQIVLPNANGKLFLNNTIIACDDHTKACTEFRFQIRNDGDVAMTAWYKVSVVGGATLYDSTIASLNPDATSVVIDDLVCALPGGLPVGMHTIKIETGPEGQAATDSYTEPLYVLAEGEPPSGISTSSEIYINVCGAEIADNCITVDTFLGHFGSDSECSIYLEYWSEGDTEHKFTVPTVVPYDPAYEEEGLAVEGVTVCIQDCEKDHYIRAVASNSVGTTYSGIISPITIRLEEPTEITQTSVTMNAYIDSMGSVSTGSANFRYGPSYPSTYVLPHIPISNTGAISRTITGLLPNTTYQYYFFARGGGGYPRTTTATVSFTTLPMTQDITFIATAPGISDLHNVDVNDVTDPENPLYLGST